MAFDRNDYAERYQRDLRERNRERRPQLTAAAMAVVPIEKLTADPAWDALLQTAQAEQNQDQSLLDGLKSQLHDDRCVSPDAIMMLKIGIARVEGRIEGRNRVMVLPVAMIETGKKALDALKDLDSA